LKKYGIRPRKRLGQHFLAAGPTIDKIVASLDLEGDDTVVEIGPGLGVMTRRIAEKAKRLVAIERDERMVEILSEELRDLGNVEIVHGDVLKTDLGGVVSGDVKAKLVGNLPYNISTPIIFWMLQGRAAMESAVVMVQREVAARMVAGPGGKDYGALTVMLQSQAYVRKLFDVSAASFVPPPEVTSSVVEIDLSEEGLSRRFEGDLRRVVRAAFGKRRKTFRNALLGSREMKLDSGRVDTALARAKIDGRVRPEEVPVEGFVLLARLLSV